MSQVAEKKYQSGEEILEHYIPGYVPPRTILDESTSGVQHAPNCDLLLEKLLSGLKSKLDQVQITKPGS